MATNGVSRQQNDPGGCGIDDLELSGKYNGCFIYQRLSLFRLRSIFVVVAKNVLRQSPYPNTNVHCLIFHGALPLFLLY